MFTKKFVQLSFTFKFLVKVWSCNRLLSFNAAMKSSGIMGGIFLTLELHDVE